MKKLLLICLVSCGGVVQFETTETQPCDCWFEQVQLEICSDPLVLKCDKYVGNSRECMPDPVESQCWPSVDPHILCCWPDVEPHPGM